MNEAVTVEQAIQILTRAKNYRAEPMTLRVVVHNPGTIGTTPNVAIIGMQAGIDWDNGLVLLKPARQLTALTQEQVDAIMVSARKGQSWHAYEAQKRLRERVRELEAERDGFRAAFHGWIEKTEWVRDTIRPHELGKHLADIMRERIEKLEAEVATLKQGGV